MALDGCGAIAELYYSPALAALQGGSTEVSALFDPRGGSRPPRTAGYAEDENLVVPMPCERCFIHTTESHRCLHDLRCMTRISPVTVLDEARRMASWTWPAAARRCHALLTALPG